MRLVLPALAFAVGTGALAQSAPRGPEGYCNSYPHPEKASFWAWQWERMRDGPPKSPPGGWNLPAAKTDPAELRAPEGNPSVTWIGRATVLARLASHTMLFDPIFSERASPLPAIGPKRVVPLPFDIDDLLKIDL